MMVTIQSLITHWKQFGRKLKQTQGDLAHQEPAPGGQPQVKCSLTREAKRWQSFQPWGRV